MLIVSGVMLTWAHNFIGNEVHTQLAAQQIYFPANNSPAIKAPEFAAMHQYAGQQLTTGAQAEVYADHFGIRQSPQGERRRQDLRAAVDRGPGAAQERRARGPGRHGVQG